MLKIELKDNMDARLIPTVLPTAKKLFQLVEAIESVNKAEAIQNKTIAHRRYIERLKDKIKALEKDLENNTQTKKD